MCNRGRPNGGSIPASSHEDRLFLVRIFGLPQSFLAIHLEGFAQGGTQIGQQFVARATLAVDTRDFFDPTDPPSVIFFDYGSK
jgi:hypothetical protein